LKKKILLINGPLFPDNPPSLNIGTLVIPTIEEACGDAIGFIRNDLTGGPVSGAVVEVQSIQELTDGSGNYIYQCPATGFKIPDGISPFKVYHDDFYFYGTGGSAWYAPNTPITIVEDTVVTYDAKIWPVGRGTVQGTVTDAGSGFPLSNIEIKITLYDSNTLVTTTNAQGMYTFQNVLETWPPTAIDPNDPYYNHTVRRHTVKATDPSGIYFPESVQSPHLDADQTIIVDFQLDSQDGL